MRILIFAVLSMVSEFALGQQQSFKKLDKIIVDSHLTNMLFTSDKHVKMKFTTYEVGLTEENGKKTDTVKRGGIHEVDMIVNSKVIDIADEHYSFDSCIAFLNQDTLVLMFRNTLSVRRAVGYDDKLIISVIKNKFFSEYLPFNSAIFESQYTLRPMEQKLVFKKLVSKKGDRLMGQLKIRFRNDHQEAPAKFLTFEGPFDCFVH